MSPLIWLLIALVVIMAVLIVIMRISGHRHKEAAPAAPPAGPAPLGVLDEVPPSGIREIYSANPSASYPGEEPGSGPKAPPPPPAESLPAPVEYQLTPTPGSGVTLTSPDTAPLIRGRGPEAAGYETPFSREDHAAAPPATLSEPLPAPLESPLVQPWPLEAAAAELAAPESPPRLEQFPTPAAEPLPAAEPPAPAPTAPAGAAEAPRPWGPAEWPPGASEPQGPVPGAAPPALAAEPEAPASLDPTLPPVPFAPVAPGTTSVAAEEEVPTPPAGTLPPPPFLAAPDVAPSGAAPVAEPPPPPAVESTPAPVAEPEAEPFAEEVPEPAPALEPVATSEYPSAPEPPVSGAVAAAAGNGKETILLIEDDERISKFYTILFESKGFTVKSARDGVEGVDMAAQLRPELILLDVMMPKMNGLMVLQTLRANPDTLNTPVVVLSNYMEPPLIQRALQLGAIEYVVKSQARPEQLVAALPSWLKGQPALH